MSNLTDQQKLQEAISMSKIGVPLSVIAKVMDIPIADIEHIKNERANNNE
jgi:hypothetical protein